MKKHLFLSFLLVLGSTNLFAENHMLILGGGGEGTKTSTLFDTSIEAFGKIASRPGWDVSMAFNGGHANTERLMKQHIPGSVKQYPDFTKESYDKILKDTIAKIKNGEIKKGETIYMFLFTHGAESTPEETTHKVSLTSPKNITNYQNLAGLDVVSVDTLEELMLLAKDKGILVGLTDMSCFGGNSLKLKEKLKLDNVCITSSAGENNPALAGGLAFGERFLKEAAKGGTVEDVFIKTRDNTILGDYPMISTEVGKELQDTTLPLLEPYFSYNDSGFQLSPLTKRALTLANDEALKCQKEDEFAQLVKHIEKLKEDTWSVRFIKQWKLKQLNEALIAYKQMQDNLIAKFENLNVKSLEEKLTFNTELIDPLTNAKSKPLTFTRREFYDFNFDEMRKNIRNKTPSEKSIDDEFRLKRYDELEKFVEKISQGDSSYKKYREATSEVRSLETDQLFSALRVNFFEKDFYNLEYKKMKREMKRNKTLDRNDPCRKIRF